MLIYDKSGRELRHRILLSFVVVEILTTQESIARLDVQMVIISSLEKRTQRPNNLKNIANINISRNGSILCRALETGNNELANALKTLVQN